MSNVNSIRETLSLGSTAILVNCNDGVYSHNGAAEVEDWTDVVNAIDGDEDSVSVEPLTGWGEYTHAVHVSGDQLNCVYFVAP